MFVVLKKIWQSHFTTDKLKVICLDSWYNFFLFKNLITEMFKPLQLERTPVKYRENVCHQFSVIINIWPALLHSPSSPQLDYFREDPRFSLNFICKYFTIYTNLCIVYIYHSPKRNPHFIINRRNNSIMLSAFQHSDLLIVFF